METKHVASPFLIKSVDADGCFSGYASVFGAIDHHQEIVMKGAFQKSLKAWGTTDRMPAMLWMHDPTEPIGLWVQMKEDEHGLAVEGQLAMATQKGREAYELLKMGALSGMSIGYRVVTSRFDSTRKARLLTEVDLLEVSLVTFPANEEARVRDVKQPPMPVSSDEKMTRSIVARLHQAANSLKQHQPRRRV